VFRRPLALPLASIVASLAVILAACNSAPAAPALTDPKEILTKAATSLTNVKTFEFSGGFTGSVKAPQLGDFDLSKVTMSGAVDVANKKLKFSLDAPTLLGTRIDALVLDETAYYKVAGPAALSLGATADKYTKVPLPSGSTDPVSQVTDVTKLASELGAGLDKLPKPPVKAADEKCGDQDCYHVTIAMTAADLQTLSPTESIQGDVNVDVWTRKNDYRPAKFLISVTTVDMGTFGVTLDVRYDVGVSVDAPPADQVSTP